MGPQRAAHGADGHSANRERPQPIEAAETGLVGESFTLVRTSAMQREGDLQA